MDINRGEKQRETWLKRDYQFCWIKDKEIGDWKALENLYIIVTNLHRCKVVPCDANWILSRQHHHHHAVPDSLEFLYIVRAFINFRVESWDGGGTLLCTFLSLHPPYIYTYIYIVYILHIHTYIVYIFKFEMWSHQACH